MELNWNLDSNFEKERRETEQIFQIQRSFPTIVIECFHLQLL